LLKTNLRPSASLPNCGRPNLELSAKKRQEEARHYNYFSWAFFVISLLAALAGAWAVAGVLFIAALIISINYHLKRR